MEVGGVGEGGWEAEGGLKPPWAQGQSHCVFIKHRNSHSVYTCQAKTVAGSSLTPHAIATLLVHPSGTRYPTVSRYKFTGSEKCCRPGYL